MYTTAPIPSYRRRRHQGDTAIDIAEERPGPVIIAIIVIIVILVIRNNIRKTDSIHHHHPEGVVYRGFCLDSSTFCSLESHFQEVVVYRIALPKYTMNSFQTSLTPSPEKLYTYDSVVKQAIFECAL